METPSHVHHQDPSRPRVMPRKDRSHRQRAPKAARVPRASAKLEVKEEQETETEVKVKVRSTVVDIDSVRKEEVTEESLGLLEAAEQEDGLKRKSLSVLEWLLMVFVLALVLLFLPLSIWFCVKVVREHERAVVFRLGHLLRGKPRGPGLLFYLPILDVCHIVDIRLKMLKVPPHTVVTKDLARPELSAVCYYQIENVALCSAALSGLTPVLQTLVQAAVRDVAAQHTLTHILLHRRRMGQQIHTAVDAAACRWGIRVDRADIDSVQTEADVTVDGCVQAVSDTQAELGPEHTDFIDRLHCRTCDVTSANTEELSVPAEFHHRLSAEAEVKKQQQIRVEAEGERDAWEGFRASLRLLHPALVLPLTPDLLNLTPDLSSLPPPPPPDEEGEDRASEETGKDSPMM